MKLIKTKTYEEMSKEALEVVKQVITENDNPVINTTTGASFDGMFAGLVKEINAGE
ncbi:TPA: glucosamine-6-phosphate deaminase, partial [Listeria innocua]|nr:glucosamine-6-phosphate deaminase [Listeria innocua]